MEKQSEMLGEAIYIHIRKNLVNLADELGQIAVSHVQQEIIRQNRIASYELYNSITYQLNEIFDAVVIKVFSSVPYAIYLNRGTVPHMSPVQAIHEYILAKRNSVGFTILNGTVESVSWAIAMVIKQKGTSATKFFDYGIQNAIPAIEQRVRDIEI